MKCPKCAHSEPGNKVQTLLKHIREKHGQDSVVKFRLKQSNVLSIKCDECGYCFTCRSAYETHKVKLHGNKKKMTKCEAFAKFVKKMRKTEKRAKKEKYKHHEKRRLGGMVGGTDLNKLSFRCPVKKCTHIFTTVDQIVKHVEAEHSPREFMVFMMGDEFLDFLGKQCERCKFLYQSTEIHTHQVLLKIHFFLNFKI